MIEMFKKFGIHNSITHLDRDYYSQFGNITDNNFLGNPKLQNLFDSYSGCSFEKGLFRIHTIG